MSRHSQGHSKRISVFDRLGPDNDRESSSHHAPPPHPSSMRHRHYSDKHVPDDRREKRDSDRLSRKRRHGYDDESASKRDKNVMPSSSKRSDPRDRSYPEKSHRMRSSTSLSSTEGGGDSGDEDKKRSATSGHSKRSKSQREPLGRGRDSKSGGITADEKGTVDGEKKDCGGEEERPSRRKRERMMESTSEGEEHRETKRRKIEDTGGRKASTDDHYHRESMRFKDKRGDKRSSGGGDDHHSSGSAHKKEGSRKRKRSLYDSFSESETESSQVLLPNIDWTSLAKLPPLPKLKEKKLSALDKFTAGAILSKIGISATLAGTELTSKVQHLVKQHLVQKYDCSESDFSFAVNEDCGMYGWSLATQIEEQLAKKNLMHTIGPCRKALVASVDFGMRKKLRNLAKKNDDVSDEHISSDETNLLPSSTSRSSTWDTEMYSASVSMYNDASN